MTELDEIQACYENPAINCIVITGMGGQGKTELCKKFIHENLKPSPSFLSWLRGDTYQQLGSSFQELAKFLNMSINDAAGKPIPTQSRLYRLLL